MAKIKGGESQTIPTVHVQMYKGAGVFFCTATPSLSLFHWLLDTLVAFQAKLGGRKQQEVMLCKELSRK